MEVIRKVLVAASAYFEAVSLLYNLHEGTEENHNIIP
jgi:hypothetical protein